MICLNSIKSNRIIVIGTVLLAIGIISTFAKAWLLDKILPSFVLIPNSIFEDYWRKPPITISTSIYVFNWTNPDEIYNRSVKPTFEEHGPYRFQQSLEKADVTWNDNDTVTYRQIRLFNYDQRQPNGDLRDNFTTINLFAMIAAYKFEDWDFLTTTLISNFLSSLFSDSIHVDSTVEDILYKGYSDYGNEVFQYVSFLTPEIPEYEKFGLLSNMNKSSELDGVINMNTGVNGNYDIRNWNYHNETSNYEKGCRKLGGSLGEIFAPRRSKENLEIFLIDACRPIYLKYKEDVVTDGILGYKYVVGKETMDNGTLNPENRCYSNGKTLPMGMFNIASCKYGFPVYLSTAHFYGADPVYLNSIEGLRPKKQKHESYVIIEPTTGVVLKVALRIQLNTYLRPVKNIALFEAVPSIFIPIFWGEMEFTLPNYLLLLLKIFLKTPSIYSIVANLVMITGIVTLCIALVSRLRIFWLKNTFSKETHAIAPKPEEVPLRCG